MNDAMAGRPARIRGTRPLALAGLPLLLLCSCTMAVEDTEIRLAEDMRTGYSAVISAGPLDKARMNKLQQDFTNCGMRVRSYRTSAKPFNLAVTLADVPTQEIGAYMPCVPSGGGVEVKPTMHEGWLYTYYDLLFRIVLPRCTLSRKESAPGGIEATRTPSLAIFPRKLTIRMPGRISASEMESSVPGLTFHKQDEEGLTTIAAAPPTANMSGMGPQGNDYCRRFLPRYTAAFPQTFEQDVFVATIHSRKAGFNLATIFSLIGLLISSGIIAAIVRGVMRRRPAAAQGQSGEAAPADRPRRRKRGRG